MRACARVCVCVCVCVRRVSLCVCLCVRSTLRSKSDLNMYSVNMNQGMEKYSNRRIMCTQMEEFVIVKQLEGKK